MFKVGLVLVATAAAGSIAEFDDSASMFKFTATEDDLLKTKLKILGAQKVTTKYVADLYEGEAQGDRVRQMFIDDFKWLVRSKQYKALAAEVQNVKTGANAAVKAQLDKINAQMANIKELEEEFIESQEEPTQEMPEFDEEEEDEPEPDESTIYTYELDNKQWVALNKAFFDLRKMEYEAMYKNAAVQGLRKKVKFVLKSSQWKKIEKDFKKLTQTESHKAIVKMQVATFNQATHVLKMTPIAAKPLSPQTSPIMFDAFHFMYVYFMAVEDGNVKPLLDFLVDGKYDRGFVEGVDPDFFQPPRLLQ